MLLQKQVKSGGSRNSGNDPGAAKRADNSSQKQAGLVLDGKLLVQKEQVSPHVSGDLSV